MKRQIGRTGLVMWAALAGLVALLAGAGLRLRLYALWFGLPAPRYRTQVTRAVHIPMPDGAILAADLYTPLTAAGCPTILIRSPYGRNWQAGWFGLRAEFAARRFAERGYYVLVQDTRGRFDSEGEFDPYVHERADGLATLAWLRQQDWFTGQLGMWGPSYLGVTQWVMADMPEMRAMFPMITASSLHEIVFPDGAFDAGLIWRWVALLYYGEKPRHRSLLWGLTLMLEVEWRVRRALHTLPLARADVIITGAPVPYVQQWLEHPAPDDPIWHEKLASVAYRDVAASVFLLGGWYDFFLRGLLKDYAALRAAGKTVSLTIGPWHHFSHLFLMWNTLKQALTWFDGHLKDTVSQTAAPVRLYVMGANEWRNYPDYPPPSQQRAYYLASQRRLRLESEDAPSETYHYNPAHPTPIVGGAQFGLQAGARDNRSLERRADVLVFTSDSLNTPFEVIGAVGLSLYVQSSQPYTDFYGRVCDVYPDGRSINICDGLCRVQPGVGERGADGVLKLTLDLWATAYQFKAGHRVRLIVASGAHPRWNRNTGGANPITDTELRPAQQHIFLDTAHPSALILPVTQG